MKNNHQLISIFLLAFFLIFSSCKKDEIKIIEEPVVYSEIDTNELTLVETFPIDEKFIGCSDITFDGTYIWALSGIKIYKLSTEGSILDTFPTPGYYPRGIAYDGTNLLVGDNNWGTGKIYKLETDVSSILELPGSGNIVGASIGKGGFWCADHETNAPMVYKINRIGEITHSFDIEGRSIDGLCFDGVNLWISYKNFEMFDHNKIAKIDTFGNFLKILDPPIDGLGGLAFVEKNLWFHAEDTFYKLDSLGNVIKSINSPVNASGDFTFDGQFLWCISPDYEEQSKLYKLDTLGNNIYSFDCPYIHQKGLAFDGTHLQLADWLTKKLYRLPTDGDYYLPFPSFDIQHLSSDATLIFTQNINTGKIVRLNKIGEIENSFNGPDNIMSFPGLSWYGENLWLVSGNSFFGLETLIKMDIDGNITAIYEPTNNIPPIHALTVNGDDVWCITLDNSIYYLSKLKLLD